MKGEKELEDKSIESNQPERERNNQYIDNRSPRRRENGVEKIYIFKSLWGGSNQEEEAEYMQKMEDYKS